MQQPVVTPWEVKGEVDYNKLVDSFGAAHIDQQLLAKWQVTTNTPPHTWMRRGLFASHRDVDFILDQHTKGNRPYIYTGRGPSSPHMHLGHLIPFMFAKYLQESFGSQVVIQITTDEKYLWKDLSFDVIRQYAAENIKDIRACGFGSSTYIFDDLVDIGEFYPMVVQVQKCITMNQVVSTFGLESTDNIGKYGFAAIEIAPAFSGSFPKLFAKKTPCLIPCAIDQDPFFRLARDVAKRVGFPKPAVIHSKFFPALQGGAKMSSSDENSAIFLHDDANTVRDKINKYAFSGGRATLEEHRRRGGDLSVDVPYKFLEIFHDDDAFVKRVAADYTSGQLTTSGMKQTCVECLVKVLDKHQQARRMLN